MVIQSATNTIRVALYNSIPDLNEDGLQSYKHMVKSEFRKSCSDEHQVQAQMQILYSSGTTFLQFQERIHEMVPILYSVHVPPPHN